MQRLHLTAALLAASLAFATPCNAQAPNRDGSHLHLQFADFDPLKGTPEVPAMLRCKAEERLWIVQFASLPTQEMRDAISVCGGELHNYLPDHAYLVRMNTATAAAVATLPAVRWVDRYQPAYRLPQELRAGLAQGSLPAEAEYNIVVVDKHRDKPSLAHHIQALGGRIVHEQPGSLLFTVALTPDQLAAAAHLDQVLWLDAVTAKGTDMDNGRIQGGGNYVQTQRGYTGTGVNAHIYEGIEATHTDFTGGATNVLSGGGADTHGHCTAGIVFGNGTSNAIVRGMAPDAGKFFTQYSSVTAGYSRWQVVQELVTNRAVSHTTASWGDATTTAYTSVSADSDDIVFDHDITWTNSQSNTGSQLSRPQAWAKNVFSVGGVNHGNDSNPANDSWDLGGASIGPAADGRLKPEICAYYEAIGTSDRTGSAGYSSANWYASFGGTSGATPMVAGHNVLLIQMFTDDSLTPGVGLFGNTLRQPGGSRHQNRPHFTTLKALQMVGASQYTFTSASTDNRREHQGFGFPNLQRLYDNRNRMFIVDETDVLTQGVTRTYPLQVNAGTPELKIGLGFSEPAGNPAVTIQTINNLSLRVTAPNGTTYWGNNGLTSGNWSTTGGAADSINCYEFVLVNAPAAGTWQVEVIATLIAADNHVETAAVDADYSLVCLGGTASTSTPAAFSRFGTACAGSTHTTTPCKTLNAGGGTLVGTTSALEYLIIVPSTAAMQVTSFDIFTQSTGGTVTCPASIYSSIVVGPPLATTTLTVGPTPGFYRATFATPVSVGTACYLGLDVSAGNVVVPNLTVGGTAAVFQRTPPAGSWAYASTVTRPAYSIDCTAGTVYDIPTLGNVGNPVLGSTYHVTLADALPLSVGFLVTGLTQNTPAYPLPGAPGCNLYVNPGSSQLFLINASGSTSAAVTVPLSGAFEGIDLFHQWAVLDNANALGIVVSDAGRATFGH